MSRRKFLQNHFRQSFESSPESRGSQTSGVLLVLFVQAKRINSFPFRKAPRFCKPRNSTPQWQLRTATIKTFLREAPRFANLVQALRFSRLRKSASVLRFTSKLKSTSASSTHTLTPTAYNAQTNRLSAAITNTLDAIQTRSTPNVA